MTDSVPLKEDDLDIKDHEASIPVDNPNKIVLKITESLVDYEVSESKHDSMKDPIEEVQEDCYVSNIEVEKKGTPGNDHNNEENVTKYMRNKQEIEEITRKGEERVDCKDVFPPAMVDNNLSARKN